MNFDTFMSKADSSDEMPWICSRCDLCCMQLTTKTLYALATPYRYTHDAAFPISFVDIQPHVGMVLL